MIKIRRLFPAVFIPVFFAFNALVYLTGLGEKTRIYLAAFVGLIGFVCCLPLTKNYLKTCLFVMFTIFSGIISIMYNHNAEIHQVLATVLYIAISLIMIYYKLDYTNIKIFFYALSSFLLYRMLTMVPASEVIHHVSRNYISVMMLVGTSLLYLAAEDNNEKISITPACVCFALSVWGVGRGGIIASGIILVGVCFIKLKNVYSYLSMSYGKIRILLCVALLIIALVIIITLTSSSLLKYFVAFNTKGMESPRTAMWLDYMRETRKSVWNWMLGTPLEGIEAIEKFSGNTHNSFIQMHAMYGLAFFIINISLIINSIMFFWKRKKYIFVVLILALIARAFTDRLFFNGYAEPLLFYYQFYPLLREKILQRNIAIII